MDVIWDELRRSEWETAVGPAPLQQQWAYGAVMARLGATVRRAQVIAEDGTHSHVQCILRRIGPLRVAWHGLPTPGSAHAADALRDEGPLIWIGPAPLGITLGQVRHHAQLDLSVPDLRARLHGKWRNRLNAAQRSGLIVSQMGGVPNWLLRAEKAQQKRARYRNMPPRWIDGWARYRADGLFTVSAGRNAAAMSFLVHGTSATYLIGWSGEEGRRHSAHNLLMWNAVQKLRAAGIATLDLGLVSPDTPGLNQFKMGTGAKLRQIPPPRLRVMPRKRFMQQEGVIV
ncbi:GNAT family N-acetyltransferase [Oceaniglobus ichthyenteri]|uniref:GNAT family N-acetyltransferase n=1 Tax=Oceaniglobus ichthyenteri TaxID=2136177 RepID=UPI000D39CF0A|nr:GNAT family N-acetyltransferase [Oceaniglobus ichthyenteri]